ncbi:MAG: M3 family metallopeptidase [Pseudomonadota bacterium]
MTQSSHEIFELPDFSNISADSISSEIPALLSTLRGRLEAIRTAPGGFENLVYGLEEIRHDLGRCWSPFSHLNMVQSDPEFQSAYVEALTQITRFATELGQDETIYAALSQLESANTLSMDTQAQELIHKMLRDFRLAGVALDSRDKARFVELTQQLSKAQAEFSNRLQQCTDAWSWRTEDSEAVSGIPETVLRGARNAAETAGAAGWLFSLTQPTYQAVITHCEHRDTRRLFYEAWMTRASTVGQHDEQWDNGPLITEILSTRQQMAELLGFDSYAEMSLAPKMADSVEQVLTFLNDLAERSLDSAERERGRLESIAGHKLEAWDTSFYLEQLRNRDFAISDDLLRPYFQAPSVLEGLFELAGRLFGLRFKIARDVVAWHDDVEFIHVLDQGGNTIGGFYMDLYARAGKRGGAWIDECVVHKALPDSQSLPVGYLVCNFTTGDGDREAQLAHQEVVTLFHEFGHMLHHLLTRVAYPSIAGINGVPWDAVELPSQFFEHYAWHYDVLKACSAHVESGEALPKALYDRLYAARNCGAGLQMLRQLEFALFDFDLHARSDAAEPGVLQSVLAETRARTTLIGPPAWNRFENGFSHIFAGGYAAGYYSYKWAEVLAADAFSAFEEVGNVFDLDTAKRFRQTILEIGGSRDIGEAFTDFRGRTARIEALLERDGILAA